MHLADYVLLAFATAAGLAVAGGGIMLTLSPPPIRAARAAFWMAATCFGILGILWGVQAGHYNIWVRTGVAGATAAAAAMALVYILSLVVETPEDHAPPKASVIRTAFSQTQSIKVLPPSYGGNFTLRLDSAATLRLHAPYSASSVTLMLDVVPVDMAVNTSPGISVEGAKFYSHTGSSTFEFDTQKNKRHEITVTGRVFVVTLLEINRLNFSDVGAPFEYVFGISEK